MVDQCEGGSITLAQLATPCLGRVLAFQQCFNTRLSHTAWQVQAVVEANPTLECGQFYITKGFTYEWD